MIDYQTFCQIRQLRDEAQLSITQIARQLGLDWQTVSKWAKQARYKRRQSVAGRRRVSKLEAFKPTIQRLLATHAYTVTQLLSRLREQGYEGRYTILRNYVREVRPRRSGAFLTLHFTPGQCAQVDWGSWGSIRVGNTRRRLSFFALVLCHSRQLYVEFTLGQSQEQWLACHEHAFEYLGGVPAEIMVDNCKTAVLSHAAGAAAVFNPTYVDFARHYGFAIKACAPRRPQQKGRIENGIGYIKKNFLAGLELTEFAPLNPAARVWMDTVANVRVHGETQRRPVDLFGEEKRQLRPLPAAAYDAALIRPVRATNRCRVVIETNRYSVPPAQAGQLLTLKLYADRLRLLSGERLVAEHLRSYEKRLDLEQPEHVRTLLHERSEARHQRLHLAFLALSAQAPAYYEQLRERRFNLRHHVEKIVALAEIYGAAAVGRALDDAHSLGAYSCEYVANLLEQRQRLIPVPGALHLTRASDLLELELPPPDLSPYHATP
ncbi:MAG: IS21 family transposase [Opitutaceae bacterium]|nr:IS21 family transposase [Opitutaceae bacterium]